MMGVRSKVVHLMVAEKHGVRKGQNPNIFFKGMTPLSTSF
jgi:hypothetical protein